MIGIGIDTGGTYTDAVIYNFETKEVIASAKSLTTKRYLTEGIRNTLDLLPAEELAKAEFLSLSTTLATNACVEEIGGRAKLVFIGVERKTVEEFYQSYGLPHPDEICFLDIPYVIRKTLDSHDFKSEINLDDVLKYDAWARNYASDIVVCK